MKSVRFLFLVAVMAAVTMSAVAQEGHPLTGTWYGDFGMTAGQRNDLTVVMKWDGANTTGIVHRGNASGTRGGMKGAVDVDEASMVAKTTLPLASIASRHVPFRTLRDWAEWDEVASLMPTLHRDIGWRRSGR